MHLRSAVLLALALALAGFWAFLRAPRASSSSRGPAVASASAATPGSAASPHAPPVATNASTPSAPAVGAPPAATPPAAASRATPPRRSVADILEAAGNLSDPAVRERTVAAMQALQAERRAAAVARALALGLPVRIVGPKGRVREVYDLDEQGRLVYRTTLNVNAARSSGASLLQAETPPLTGSGVIVGIWDAGFARKTHQELNGRVTYADTDTTIAVDDHSTHVGGTIGASGVVPSAKGMAPAVSISSYDWNSDYAEMTAAGATTAGQSTKIYLSNHSYGTVSGWDYTGEPSPMWIWYGTGTTTTGTEQTFGQYNTDARDIDAVVYSTPYLLPFWAAGNDGTDDPVNGESVQLNPDNATTDPYNSASHPKGDGQYRGGYETIASSAIGKNVLTVGAATDAVTGTTRDVAKAALVDFSSVGPTDDGRIKPDLVANGDELYSSVGTSNTAYDTYSGTSMATPSAAGSTALLVQLYRQLFPSGALRASTLKALLLHTADDLGTAGPDYKNGWGLINVKAAADLLREHAANPLKLRVNESQVTTTTTTVTYDFTWDGTSPIRATLCWTDPAGTATTGSDSRTSRLVNNLDLKITGPTGSEHLPFVMPFVGTWTQASMATPATTGLNSTDNVEQVYLATPPAAGVYHAVVTFRGTLTNAAQDFGLIITGSTAEPPPATAPTITTHPASQSAVAGTNVTLSVAASGTAPFTYQWRKNTQAIDGATNASLTLTNVQPADAGSYDVVVTNSVSSVTSNAATLTVNVVTTTTISWNFTSSSAPSSTLPTGLTGGTVAQGNNLGTTTLLDAQTTSAGAYTGASGGNNAGLGARTGALNTATGGSGYFTFTLTPDTGKRLVATAISFAVRRSGTGPTAWSLYSSVDNYTTALATGTVSSQSTWYLSTPSINVTGALSTPVTFRLYGYNGSGSYSGGAANFRIDDLALTVAVQTAPTITTPPASQTVAAGADATFTVVASGTDPLSYQWRKNTNLIGGATTASYTIVGAQSIDAASYDVVVTNPAGSATSAAATLTVLSGFASWQQGYFDATERADPLISGPTVVLTADGLTNLMKYALGLNPRIAATSGLPVTTSDATNWTFTFTRPVDRADITYTVQASADLVDWSTLTLTPTKIDTTNGVETWRAEYPLANAAKLFFRLRVDKP